VRIEAGDDASACGFSGGLFRRLFNESEQVPIPISAQAARKRKPLRSRRLRCEGR